MLLHYEATINGARLQLLCKDKYRFEVQEQVLRKPKLESSVEKGQNIS